MYRCESTIDHRSLCIRYLKTIVVVVKEEHHVVLPERTLYHSIQMTCSLQIYNLDGVQ